jgi:RNA polymerase sigma-70 factor, ECF subfamily
MAASSLPARAPEAAVPDHAKTELLVRLLIRHQDELFRYIYALLPHQEDARDALQETCVALYRKHADYDPAKPFLAWAYGFAYLQVLKHRERSCRDGRLLRDDLFELLARERDRQDAELHTRLEALESCLQNLPAEDRELIQQRYTANCPIDELVERLGTSRRTLFRNLDRIRRTLFECINHKMQVTS